MEWNTQYQKLISIWYLSILDVIKCFSTENCGPLDNNWRSRRMKRFINVEELNNNDIQYNYKTTFSIQHKSVTLFNGIQFFAWSDFSCAVIPYFAVYKMRAKNYGGGSGAFTESVFYIDTHIIVVSLQRCTHAVLF